MKKLILFGFVLCAWACKKDSISSDSKLISVTVSGKTHQSFEYNQAGNLIRENEFYHCTATPVNEFVYTYKNNKIEKINTVIRGIYSSLSAMCDPSKGMLAEDIFLYNSSGSVSKIVRTTHTTEFIYNQQGFLSKVLYGGGSNKFSEYFYDSRGNMIKQISPEGQVTEYEYDSAPNPFYQHRPNVATAFLISPNNIIKGKGASNFVRKFEYKSNRPVKVLEDNGQTYEYHYN